MELVLSKFKTGITKPCIDLHPAPSTSTQLYNTLNNIWTKILYVIGQTPQI